MAVYNDARYTVDDYHNCLYHLSTT